MDLGGGFGETSPSHSAQAIKSLPCSEDILDPTAHLMDRLISLMQFAQGFSFVAAPHPRSDNSGNAGLCADYIARAIAAIGAVGKDFVGIVGQGFRTCLAVINLGGCDQNFLDQRRRGVGANVGLEGVNSPRPLVLNQPAHHSRIYRSPQSPLPIMRSAINPLRKCGLDKLVTIS